MHSCNSEIMVGGFGERSAFPRAARGVWLAASFDYPGEKT